MSNDLAYHIKCCLVYFLKTKYNFVKLEKDGLNNATIFIPKYLRPRMRRLIMVYTVCINIETSTKDGNDNN